MASANLYVLHCLDREDPGTLRTDMLAQHLAYVAANLERYLVAGPLSDPSSGAQCGSLFVVYAQDRADLEAFMHGDPYYRCSLYQRVQVHAFTAAAGSAVGGITW